MGLGQSLGEAYYKAQLAAGTALPSKGSVLVSVNTSLADDVLPVCRDLIRLGFRLFTTEGTGRMLAAQGVSSTFVHKLGEGRPDIRDRVVNREIDLIFNTPRGKKAQASDKYIRLLAKQYKLPILTTVWGMEAAVEAIAWMQKGELPVKAIQDYYLDLGRAK